MAIAPPERKSNRSAKLSWRASFLLGTAILGVVGAVYTVSALIVMSSFATLERQKTELNLNQASDALLRDLESLGATAEDYATWDDTYAYVQGDNPDYVSINLGKATFSNLGLNILALTNSDRTLIYGAAYNRTTGQLTDLPSPLQTYFRQQPALLNHATLGSRHAGFIVLSETPVLLVSQPIVMSDGSGPVGGSVVLGRYLNSDEINRLTRLTKIAIDIYPLQSRLLPTDVQRASRALSQKQDSQKQDSQKQDIVIKALDSDTIAGYQLLDDIEGNPSLLLRITVPRDIYQQSIASIKLLSVAFLLAGTVFGVIIWLLTKKLVGHITERDRMEQALQQETALRQSEAKYREKAQELEQTLHELQSAQTQLVQSEKMSSLGQLVAGIAHEINNPVSFISGNITYADEYWRSVTNLLRLYQTHCPTPAADVAEHMVGMNLDFITEDFEKILISMKTGAERIRQLVLSLRNFARLDESDMKFVDIHEGIENTLTMLQHQLNGEANRAKIEIIKEYSHLPVVECYPGQLNQVILYLLSNAIDALEDGIGDQIAPANGEWIAPTIRICTQVLDQHQVEIRIADNGRGIPESL
ncbi:MAG TPA: CHASE4 domain-containing protein, partial [Chroococcidiopsis sp.]